MQRKESRRMGSFLMRKSWLSRTAWAILTISCLPFAGSESWGQQAPLSVEEVIRAARDVLDKVRDGKGSLEHYLFIDLHGRVTETYKDCYNLAFIGPPRGAYRRDYKELSLLNGGQPPEQKRNMDALGSDFEYYSNGAYEMEFSVDRREASIRERYLEAFTDDYKGFHPLFQTSFFLHDGPELNQFRLTSYKAGVYTIERPYGPGINKQSVLILAIDEKRGFSIQEVIKRTREPSGNGFVYSRTRIEPVEWAKGIWLPRTIESEHYRLAQSDPTKVKVILRERANFRDLKLNIGLRPADLEITLPKGTELDDERTGITTWN